MYPANHMLHYTSSINNYQVDLPQETTDKNWEVQKEFYRQKIGLRN